MVLSSEGLFQAYNIDLDNGGECSLMKEFAWVICFRRIAWKLTCPADYSGPKIPAHQWAENDEIDYIYLYSCTTYQPWNVT